MLLAVDWLALGVGKHNGVVDNAIPALDDFARKVSAGSSNLKGEFVNFVGHTRPNFGYSIGRRNLSYAAFVLANLRDMIP